MNHCYHCGSAITEGAFAILVVESHTGRIGTAHLHNNCAEQPLTRYRQTINWDGATVGNLSAFKRLHGRVAAMNGSSFGSVPVILS
jgi:hypothetical protein